jgi:hypothetical protein
MNVIVFFYLIRATLKGILGRQPERARDASKLRGILCMAVFRGEAAPAAQAVGS